MRRPPRVAEWFLKRLPTPFLVLSLDHLVGQRSG
jgi:hypothetical protein